MGNPSPKLSRLCTLSVQTSIHTQNAPAVELVTTQLGSANASMVSRVVDAAEPPAPMTAVVMDAALITTKSTPTIIPTTTKTIKWLIKCVPNLVFVIVDSPDTTVHPVCVPSVTIPPVTVVKTLLGTFS